MSLALGGCEMFFDDNRQDFYRRFDRAVPLALFETAEDIAAAIARDPATPEDTGALKDSIRVAPPGYDQIDYDYAIVTRIGRPDPLGDPPNALNRDGTRSPRASFGRALDAHRGVRLAAGASQGDFTGDYRELVVEEGERYHTWVGSWLPYSFYVHNGFYNVLSGKPVAGRPYISRVALALFKDAYPERLRQAWASVQYSGA